MIDYHCYSNHILYACFDCRNNKHFLAAYNSTMKQPTSKGLSVNLHILDNGVSTEIKLFIK